MNIELTPRFYFRLIKQMIEDAKNQKDIRFFDSYWGKVICSTVNYKIDRNAILRSKNKKIVSDYEISQEKNTGISLETLNLFSVTSAARKYHLKRSDFLRAINNLEIKIYPSYDHFGSFEKNRLNDVLEEIEVEKCL